MSFKPFEGELDADSKFVPFDGELDGEPAEDLSKPYIGFKPPMTKAAQGVGEAVVGEGERLRDAVFSGVDNVRAGFYTMGFAQRASRVQTLQSQVAEMEARGDGDSLAAQSLRREIKGVQQSLPESAAWAASAQADAKRGGAMTSTPVMQEMAQAKTFGEAWEAFKKAPYDVISTITAQSMPAILPALATAAVAGPVPGALAMGASSGVTEAGSSLGKFASDAGVDVTDPKALQAFFSDPENMSKAMAFSGKRAGIIATADAVSGGIAGKIIAPAMRSGVARQAVNMPAQMGVQAGLGAGGEAGAQLATEGKISSPGEVLMEAVGELGGAPMEVATFGREARKAEQETTDPIAAIAPAQTVDEAIVAATQVLDAQPVAAQAVANIERILGEGNVSTPTAVQPGDSGAAGGGVDLAAPGVAAGPGTDGAALPAVDARGPAAELPAADLPQPAGPDLDALRTDNATFRGQAIQALQSQQGAPAEIPAPRSPEPAAQLPPAGPAALEEGGVAAPPAAPSARQVAIDAEKARIEEKRAQRRAAAQEASQPMEGLSVGSLPTNAEPVSVKDGVVYIGKYPAQNFNTGEDIVVPAGATPQQIAAALRESGALGKRAKFFGLPTNESPAQTSQKPEPTLASPEQQRADFAAAEKARTAPGNRASSRAHDANPFKAFIAKHGISSALANEFAPGKKERQAAMVQGYGPVFRKSGLQLDALAELAVQDGYLTTPDVTKLAAMIGEVLRGKRVIPQYAEGAAETEMESRAALEKEAGEEQNVEVEAETRAEREAIQALAELSDESLQALASDDAVLTAGNNVSEADFLRALGATEQEIEDATQGQGRKGQDDQGRPGPQEAAAGAAPRGAESRDGETRSAAEGLSDAARTDKAGDEKPQAPDATGGRVARPGTAGRAQDVSLQQPAQGLTAPTRDEVVAKQDRAEAGTKAEAKAKTDAEQRARADSELPDFTLTGSDRPADQAEARGQGGLFDRPASELSAAQLLRAAADKMDGTAEKPAAKPAEPVQQKPPTAEKPAKTEPQEPMFAREEGRLPSVINPSTVANVRAAITELLGGKQLASGLGRIVATTSAEIKSTWEPLIGHNVQIGSEGEAGVAQAFFEPGTKTVFMIADHINVGAEAAVLAHELMHKHGLAVLGQAGWDRLHGMIGTWKDAAEDSDERFVYDYATRKVQAVGEELSTQELFPYAVEAAIRMGIKPSLQAKRGTVASWLESVRQSLKTVWGKITGKPDTFKAQDLVDLAFGIAQMENPENAALQGVLADQTETPAEIGIRFSTTEGVDMEAEQKALQALGENDELFALPKSDKTTVAEIAADNNPHIKVRETKIGNETLYTLTMPNGEDAKLWVRPANPYAEQIYSMDLVDGDTSNVETGRPGENPEDVDPAVDDVYLDVSNLKPGQDGNVAYNIAATFAHNTGRIFIGDPSGLSDIAVRRRLENMISTALKFGTTDHIAPHPRQVKGAAGVPPLKWVYGDSLGNIRRMIDVSLKAEENSGKTQLAYDTRTGNFSEEPARRDLDAAGGQMEQVSGPAARGLPRVQSATEPSRRTEKRAALFRALLRETSEGRGGAQRGRDGILAGLSRVRDQFPGAAKGIFYSRRVIVGKTNRHHTPDQLRAMRNVGFEVDVSTMKERAQALWQDAGKKLAQGIVDQFAPVKDLDQEAYGLLRLAKGASGAFEVFLHGGKLKLTDGVYDFDESQRGGVVDKLLIPLQGEHHDFMRWIAANRAERLTAEGRENLFSPQDIADLKTLADGMTNFDYTIQTGPGQGRVTRDRTLIYADAQRVFNGFNKNVLDLAEQSGLIDGASRHLWEHEFYVPFYRVAEEDGSIRGANIKGGVVRQEAFKKLKGGTQELNADLLDNTLMNWAHLLDAAAKNRAAKATIEAAEKLGAATQVPSGTKKSVWFMDKGEKHHAVVDDPYLLTAITSLEYAGMRNPVMNAMGTFKHYLTIGVTASPFFKIRNLIRDSMQVVATSGISPNVATNVSKGWALTNPQSDEYFRLMSGGGTIHFGTMLEGSEAKRVQALVESGVDDATIFNNEHKVKQFYRKFVEPGVTAYNELGNRGEAINRASLYDQLRKQGISHAEASLQARDLMDFSMQGSFTTIRFLTQVVPFFNARLQGMYKLGRAAKEDPKRMAAVIGAVSLVSLSLLAAYGDDDDWKKREEWDRNNYWWFKFGGTAFRIPKPFEIGAMATLAERGFELMFDKEMNGKRFRKQVLTLLSDNLSMNPVPQLVKPVLDIYANKDSFTNRPIESMSMEKLKPEYRFTDRTSMLARGASKAANSVTGLAGMESLSPVQIDHLLRGYFGWLGSFVVGAGDIIARPATGQPKQAAPDYWKMATGGMISNLSDAPSRYVSQMYDQAREIEQAYGTWQALQKQGKKDEAKEFVKENLSELKKYDKIADIKKYQSQLNEQIRYIERSNNAPDVKREKIRKLQNEKDRVARYADR
jgi:hypothetical protein